MRPLGEIDFACGSSVLWSVVIVSYRWAEAPPGAASRAGGEVGRTEGWAAEPQALAVQQGPGLALGYEDTAPGDFFGKKATKHIKKSLTSCIRAFA